MDTKVQADQKDGLCHCRMALGAIGMSYPNREPHRLTRFVADLGRVPPSATPARHCRGRSRRHYSRPRRFHRHSLIALALAAPLAAMEDDCCCSNAANTELIDFFKLFLTLR